MSVPALVMLWSAILIFCWCTSLVVAFAAGRNSLERDAMYAAFEAVIQKAGQASALTDSVVHEIGRPSK